MKWTIKLVFEAVPGSVENELGTIERAEEISPATVGLTIAEGKALLASLQQRVVTAQGPRLYVDSGGRMVPGQSSSFIRLAKWPAFHLPGTFAKGQELVGSDRLERFDKTGGPMYLYVGGCRVAQSKMQPGVIR
jgi:hypothetical protein